MYKLQNPYPVVCVQQAYDLSDDKIYTVIGDSSDSIDPFDFNLYVINDKGELHGYFPWRFKKLSFESKEK
jgi:hypothetical protein